MSEANNKGMKPIWHFVGLLMLVVGLIILGTGLYYIAYPPENAPVLHELHPDVWWGAVMTLFGAVLLRAFKGVTVE